jgi:(R,R)-butanediol dehydrogenase / meso-butanediol dehydrogenase / diacetyl reductase
VRAAVYRSREDVRIKETAEPVPLSNELLLRVTAVVVAADDLPRALQLLGRRAGSWADVAPVALALEDLVDQGIRPLASGMSTRVKTLVDPWAPATRRTQP